MEEFYSHPWVIFTLKEEQYGVAAPYVRTMVAMPEVTDMPTSPDHIRGVINLRGQVTPLLDLRRRLGMSSFLDTINGQISMLQEREKDHRNWLSELENSVNENRPFSRATDHHKCKFGQWYDSYKPKSFEEGQFLTKFVTPHRLIHQVAIHVEEFIKQGEQEKAIELIEKTRQNELSEMIRLFAQFSRITKKQAANEIAIVLESSKSRSAIAVDSIMTVEKLATDSIEPMPDFENMEDNPLAAGLAKSGKDNSMVCLLKAEAIIGETHS